MASSKELVRYQGAAATLSLPTKPDSTKFVSHSKNVTI
jgi:hypothetical protein